MTCKQTQGRKLITLLKRRAMTTMDMLRTEISVSPWKRISESLKAGERLEKTKNRRGLNVYRVRG
ncbi:hypothetical protein [Methylibium sp.]|uniref:hypothetical protein n=1 Tax=Methylibium sp. TaxID=2067992 RepID=UPI003BAD64BA